MLCAALQAGEAKRVRTTYPVTYEGGNLALSHNKVKASIENDEVVLAQRRQRIAVPVGEITEISYGSQTHRRLGAAVLGKAETHYVGVTWADNASRTEVLFRVDKGEYREFLASLERMTGKKAVDTSQVPTAVRYSL